MNNSNFPADKTVYADLRNDFMFKKAFGQKDIMIPFLNDILETDKILDIEYRNVEQLGFDPESAKVYYDIYCHCTDGKDFIVEMQRRSQKYYRERMVFYSTYPIQHQYVEAKRKYGESTDQKVPFSFRYRLCPVYIISITDFTLDHEDTWPEDRFVSRYSIRENSTGELYCETLNYVFVELPRFRKALQRKSAVAEKWAFVFNNITNLTEVPEELSEKYFRKLFESAKIANFTTDEQMSYIESQKMKYDYENVLEYAVEQATEKGFSEGEAKGRMEGKAEGRAEGMAEGRAEGKAEGRAEGKAEGKSEGEQSEKRRTAKRLFTEGMDISFVSRITGLSISDLSALQ